jgi:predicted site-specific integrase-resolvase
LQADEARRYLGISVVTLHRLVRRGLLHPNRHLKRLVFSRIELDRFLSETRNRTWPRRAACYQGRIRRLIQLER